ncbi:MAG TPA: response regulator [Blastocatellia bacterium]|nr:response regulator [Blastocatellia bacterium]
MASILLVDDDEQLRTMLSVVLRRAGYEVRVAIDGIEASNFYRSHPTDLIITDLIMPEKEGLEMIRELRKDYPQVKIIAMSGGGRTGTMNCLEVARAFGAQQVLEKPFTHQEMLEAIRRVLGE